MKVALAAFGLVALTGCVRSAEGVVRERAASLFGCSEYALDIEEVGPDVYRAAGCGQELIYACHPTAPSAAAVARAEVGDDAAVACERRLR